MPRRRPRLGVDRLTGPDLSGLLPEERGWPADMGVIAVLDGARLLDGGGRLRVADIRDRVAGRLHLAPRLRQVIHRPPLGLGRPLWVDARFFDIADHVRVQALPTPADEEGLLQACEQLRRHPLDRSRPLWQLWLLPGLPDGAVGMFVRLHHAIADGPAGVALLVSLLDTTPDATSPAPLPWAPRPWPSTRDLLTDNLRRCAGALTAAASHLLHPTAASGRRQGTWPPVRELLARPRAPRTSLNRPIGAVRRIAVVRSDLQAVKDAAHAAGATVNDAVLAAVAGGLRDLLRSRGENVTDLVLRALVPVTLHNPSRGPVRGNLYGAMVVSLPVGEPDPARALRLIAAQTARRKRQPGPPWGTGVLGAPLVQRLALRFVDRQRLISIHVANVAGPAAPLYLAGARLIDAFPVVPLSGNLTLGLGVLSYGGQLNVTTVADRDGCPDLPAFTAGLTRSLSALTACPGPGPP